MIEIKKSAIFVFTTFAMGTALALTSQHEIISNRNPSSLTQSKTKSPQRQVEKQEATLKEYVSKLKKYLVSDETKSLLDSSQKHFYSYKDSFCNTREQEYTTNKVQSFHRMHCELDLLKDRVASIDYIIEAIRQRDLHSDFCPRLPENDSLGLMQSEFEKLAHLLSQKRSIKKLENENIAGEISETQSEFLSYVEPLCQLIVDRACPSQEKSNAIVKNCLNREFKELSKLLSQRNNQIEAFIESKTQ